ncbi:MAG: penicillin-binding transpeptidase domain-containing protein [Oscillospiraceae bacterium]
MPKKRIFIILSAVMLLYVYGVYSVFVPACNQEYAMAVAAQSNYSVPLAKSRGTIYDCNLKPLTNQEENILAVVMPCPEGVLECKKNLKETPDGEAILKNGKPFSFFVAEKSEAKFIDFFPIPKRYGEECLCPNLLGYVDGSGSGVTGVERAFDEILAKPTGELTLHYTADALGRIIVGEERKYENTMKGNFSGVALTIDSEIQRSAEKAASTLKKGAVVVVSVPDCKVKALVSKPDFNPNQLDLALQGADAPLINRAFTGFAPGSVFKLVISAAALNSGVNSKATYHCTGNILVDDMAVTCYDGKSHGDVNLHTALQKSCNCYFIDLANRLAPQTLYQTALNLGLGTETYLNENLVSSAGNIPTVAELDSPRSIANFSIGQGDVLVTPLQIAALVNTIAAEGKYTSPKLYEGEVSDEKELLPSPANTGSISAMEALVAFRLKGYMESTSKYGTAQEGAPDGITSGAKTGTAQTGVYAGSEELLNYWYAGYIESAGKGSYAIVVLSEGDFSGKNPTPKIYKTIAEAIHKTCSS